MVGQDRSKGPHRRGMLEACGSQRSRRRLARALGMCAQPGGHRDGLPRSSRSSATSPIRPGGVGVGVYRMWRDSDLRSARYGRAMPTASGYRAIWGWWTASRARCPRSDVRDTSGADAAEAAVVRGAARGAGAVDSRTRACDRARNMGSGTAISTVEGLERARRSEIVGQRPPAELKHRSRAWISCGSPPIHPSSAPGGGGIRCRRRCASRRLPVRVQSIGACALAM